MSAVSLIIPVYNGAKTIRRTLESVLEQTFDDFELVIVNDGSTDETEEICNEFAAAHSHIKVFSKENGGLSSARNAGIACATGEYICFLDADDTIQPEFLETLYSAVHKYDADAVRSGITFVGGINFDSADYREDRHSFAQETVFETPEEMHELVLGFAGAKACEPFDERHTCSVNIGLMRKSVITDNHLAFMPEKEVLSEDLVFLLDFFLHCSRAVGIHYCGYNYIRNQGSLSKSNADKKIIKLGNLRAAIIERLSGVIDEKVYLEFIDKKYQADFRYMIVQIIANNNESGLNSKIRDLLKDKTLQEVLHRFPIWQLPKGQALFAFGMKHKMPLLLRALVSLKKRKA